MRQKLIHVKQVRVTDSRDATILKLTYRPTKVINDKVYDIRVETEILNPSLNIKEVEIKLIPVEYPHFITSYGMRKEDYLKVFPPEDVRTVRFIPSRVEREAFSTIFQNLKGGREYVISARLRDSLGKVVEKEVKTQYIRQFENLGKQLYEKGIIVSASYMPWNMKEIVGKYNLPDKPLLGLYDTFDDVVEWKHIDWAGYCGVNVFWIDLYGVERGVFLKMLNKEILVGGMWGPSPEYSRGTLIGLPEWAIDLKNLSNEELFLKDIEIFSQFSSHANYLKIHNRPAIFLYDAMALFREEASFNKAKSFFREKHGREAYFVSDTLPRIPTTPDDEYIKTLFKYKDLNSTDALTSWVGFMDNSRENRKYAENYDDYYEDHLRIWSNYTRSLNKEFVPTVIPGFYNGYSWGEQDQIPIARSPNLFYNRLLSTLKYSENHIRIDTWNDFGEWTYIEPSVKEGFAYLSKLREVLLEFSSTSEGGRQP